MKKQFKLSLLAITLLGALSTSAFAQNADIVNPNQTLELDMGVANPFEKEVTPLLREMSLKKALLELRKVERELEKLNEEALKAQTEREKSLATDKLNVNSISAGPMGGIALPNAPAFNGFNTPPPSLNSNSAPEVDNAIKILMIYGFADNLYAKVATGSQGGFVVREGDVLPDGRLVKKITPNYVEVKLDNAGKKSKKKDKTERIFVSYTPSPDRSDSMKISTPEIKQMPMSLPSPMLTPLR